MPSNPTGPSWADVANSFSICGIAKHRDLTSIRALLYFAGRLLPANGLVLDDDYPESYFYDWGEEVGNSKDLAGMRVWNEIRAAWYCCLNIFHPNDKPEMVMEEIQTREPRRISLSEMLARPPVMMKFPRLLYDGKRFQGTESESHNEETYRDGDDKDMVALQGGMGNLKTKVKDGEETFRDEDYKAMVALSRRYGNPDD